VLFLAVVAIFVGGLSKRKGFAVDIIKDRGALARELGNGDVENIYRLKVMNTTESTQTYTASVQGLPGLTLTTDPVLSVPATGIGSLTIRLPLPYEATQAHRGKASPILFRVEATGQTVVVEEKSTFLIPR
jgi:polyferredoxin